MSLVRDASSPSGVVQGGTAVTTLLTPSFTPPAGALLLVLSAWHTGTTGRTVTTTTEVGSTSAWTRIRLLSSTGGLVEMSWATVTASVATRVRTTYSGAATYGLLSISVITGAAGAPVGQSGTMAAADTSTTVAYTTTALGSRMWAVYDDYLAGVVATSATMTRLSSSEVVGTFVAAAWQQPTLNGAAGTVNSWTFNGTEAGAALGWVELLPAQTFTGAGALGGNGTLTVRQLGAGAGALGGAGTLAASAPQVVATPTGNLAGIGYLRAGAMFPQVTRFQGLSGVGTVVGKGGATLEQYVYVPRPPVRPTHDTQWRYIAQRILTGEYLNWALPLTTDGPEWALSGPGSLAGTITPQLGQLLDQDGVPILQEWGTAIYAEADGVVRWGGILVRSGFTGAEWSIEAAGFTTYPTGIPYTGPEYSRISQDPLQVVRYLWDHVQSQPDGNVGMEYAIPTNCPVRIGTPAVAAYDEVQLTDDGEWVRRDSVAASKIIPNAASTLGKAVTDKDTSITLKTLQNFGKPALPFTITIGTEDLQVTHRSGLKLTVVRGFGSTKAGAHSKGTGVKYTGTPVRTIEAVEAEPYTLAWYDAPDCGEEIDKLAQETPFDYIEEHFWDDASSPGTPVVSGQASLRLGYGNLEGGYDGTDKGWMKDRADNQAKLIGTMNVAVFGACELHEETSAAMPNGGHRWFEGRMKALVDKDWTLGDGFDGGNHVLYRASMVLLLNVVNRRGADDQRWMTMFTFQDKATGQVFNFSVDHLHANDDDGTNRDAMRTAEARDRGAYYADKAPLIAVGDFNDYETTGSHPKAILAKYGLKGMQVRTNPKNADLNSGTGSSNKGHWIDDMLTRDDVDLSEAAGVLTNKASDHRMWLSMRVTFHAAAASTTVYTAGQGAIRHRLRISYPRAGRKRNDLAFIQGSNITDVVPVTRDGDAFANHVYGIGVGEGAAALRTEVAVRDGRLRRAAVYTDKTATTESRLSALARGEWNRRQLDPEVASIVVIDHPNARIGSWTVGDDILVRADLPWIGYVEIWSRITGWQLNGESKATLTLQRSDRFVYGAAGETPTVDVPAPDPAGPPLYGGLGLLAGDGALGSDSAITEQVAAVGVGALSGVGTLVTNATPVTVTAVYDVATYDTAYYA